MNEYSEAWTTNQAYTSSVYNIDGCICLILYVMEVCEGEYNV